MRTGANPAKLEPFLETNTVYHRIIVPVYIPNLDGYFKESLDVLKLCLGSLLETINESTTITVINNGSCREVRDYLNGLSEQGKIDQVIHNRDNLGKVDPIISVARGCHEPLLTVTDADVLFMSGWTEEIERVLRAFPRAGMVSPAPHPCFYAYCNTSPLIEGVISGKLKSGNICHPDDLHKFADSVGWEGYPEEFVSSQYYFENKGVKALAGCGHFVATFRREFLAAVPEQPSRARILGNSELNYLDKPLDLLGLWRLATPKAYAYHMGNTLEPWMQEIFPNSESKSGYDMLPIPPVHRSLTARLPLRLRQLMLGLIRRLGFLKR